MSKTLAFRVVTLVGVVALALLVALLAPRPAAADFGDCSSPDYLARFDERFRTIEYDCVERLRVPVATRDGVRHIRLLHDFNADWLTDEAMLAEFDRGVRLAVEQLGRIGAFDLRDVSILLADDFPPRRDAETFTNFAAWTLPDASGAESECQVVVFLLGPGAEAEYAAAVVAHEVFHCVQKASLAPELMNSRTADGRGGAWWMEGAAEWFASAAVPDRAFFQNRIDGFDADSPDTPLHRLSYDALPFFLWLAGERGETAVLPFLAGMAGDSSDAAQVAAMRDALSEEQWLDFAEAYLDGEIRRPRGEPLRFQPRDGDTLRWDASRRVRRPLQPFVIDRAWIECDCGTWTASAEPSDMHRVRPDDGRWGALPGRIDTEAGDPAWFRLAAVNTGPARRELVFDLEHQVRCEGCGEGALDRCIVGSWRMSGGGPAEWMRREFGPDVAIPHLAVDGQVVTFTGHGTYDGGPIGFDMTMTRRSAAGMTRADGSAAAGGTGRWSAAGGRLTLCPATERLEGRVRVTRPDGSSGTIDLSPEAMARTAAAWREMLGGMPPEVLARMPADLRAQLMERAGSATPRAAASGPTEMTYACSGDVMTTTLPVRGAGPIVTGWTRVG